MGSWLRQKSTAITGMYFGIRAVYVATSQDFIHWKPVEDGQGLTPKRIMLRST